MMQRMLKSERPAREAEAEEKRLALELAIEQEKTKQGFGWSSLFLSRHTVSFTLFHLPCRVSSSHLVEMFFCWHSPSQQELELSIIQPCCVQVGSTMSRLARADLVVRRFALWLLSALTQLKMKIPSHPTFPVSPRGADLVDQVQRLSLGDAVTRRRCHRRFVLFFAAAMNCCTSANGCILPWRLRCVISSFLSLDLRRKPDQAAST
jgi:hypothetical protein